ncbi:30722_t:CDS:2 [Gigaspora margarita]|uniref:30722_t:CDS:1 n=1 Tax=Gigaspora margarita TaxID=4874 RepID=A0ABN7UQ25_GIGMA|nr:30722_t:CDS:2 [Gigaspora margarita]
MIAIIFCFIVLFLFTKLFEKALDENLRKYLEENKDNGTEDEDVFEIESIHEEILDTLISFVRENNKKLEWLSRDICEEAGEVATLVEELAELVMEQQEKITRCLFHQHEKKNKKNTLKNEFTKIERKDSQFNLQKPVPTY